MLRRNRIINSTMTSSRQRLVLIQTHLSSLYHNNNNILILNFDVIMRSRLISGELLDTVILFIITCIYLVIAKKKIELHEHESYISDIAIISHR